jgi:ferredoxin
MRAIVDRETSLECGNCYFHKSEVYATEAANELWIDAAERKKIERVGAGLVPAHRTTTRVAPTQTFIKVTSSI